MTKSTQLLPALRMALSQDALVSITLNNKVEVMAKCGQPTSAIEGLFFPESSDIEGILNEIKKQAPMLPYGLCIKNMGLVVVAASAQNAFTASNIFEASLLGKEMPVAGFSDEQANGKAQNKIFVVTGGAQGFGEGIVRDLYQQGANIVVADLNGEKAMELASELNASNKGNKVAVCISNVSDAASVETMVDYTVKTFGGLDVMVSNAGILRAGSLDEMTPETFELMTKVNYSGYFLCAKYASSVMKIQHQFKQGHFMDIIQINSKSGLKGSNKNFAYAGGKFGGIGLTQSWALELMPYNIKVNSICPGNFFDGPLWSDPTNGLFVQYLNAGKVPGAQTIDDVKRFYEAQVPANRGCRVADVMRAIYYVIEQEYETGQAIPVTGGQNMLK
jgi:NAD(P)-dependent dehydrogenase (short-subunit alcohol dehydrogenase family)